MYIDFEQQKLDTSQGLSNTFTCLAFHGDSDTVEIANSDVFKWDTCQLSPMLTTRPGHWKKPIMFEFLATISIIQMGIFNCVWDINFIDRSCQLIYIVTAEPHEYWWHRLKHHVFVLDGPDQKNSPTVIFIKS